MAARTRIPIPEFLHQQMQQEQHEEKLQTPVAELGLPVRVVNTIEESLGVVWVADFFRLGVTVETLAEVPNLGPRGIRQIQRALSAKLDLALPEKGNDSR